MRATNRGLTTRSMLASRYLVAMLRASLPTNSWEALAAAAFQLADAVLKENDRERDAFDEWFNRTKPDLRL